MFGILVLPFDSKLQEYPLFVIFNPPLIDVEPLTFNEPVISTVFPAACIRLLLLLSSVPLPTIKAASTEDVALNWPCTC